jgi:hypothetical protein
MFFTSLTAADNFFADEPEAMKSSALEQTREFYANSSSVIPAKKPMSWLSQTGWNVQEHTEESKRTHLFL